MTFSKTIQGDSIVFRIEGELDALTAPELRPALDDVANDKPKKVTLDLSAMRIIDSSGVGALVSLFKRVRSAGGDVTIVGLQGQPLAIFKLLRLDRVFALEA